VGSLQSDINFYITHKFQANDIADGNNLIHLSFQYMVIVRDSAEFKNKLMGVMVYF
jgi:hypothetical protein